MFEQQGPTIKDRLRILFHRYSNPIIPPTHLSINSVRMTLLYMKAAPSELTGQEKRPNGTIDHDIFSDGKTFTYNVSYEQDGNTYESHVIGKKITNQTMEITSLMLDNEPQSLKSPQEIYAVLKYMDENFVLHPRYRTDAFVHQPEKPFALSKFRRQIGRIGFAVKRGL